MDKSTPEAEPTTDFEFLEEYRDTEPTEPLKSLDKRLDNVPELNLVGQ